MKKRVYVVEHATGYCLLTAKKQFIKKSKKEEPKRITSDLEVLTPLDKVVKYNGKTVSDLSTVDKYIKRIIVNFENYIVIGMLKTKDVFYAGLDKDVLFEYYDTRMCKNNSELLDFDFKRSDTDFSVNVARNEIVPKFNENYKPTVKQSNSENMKTNQENKNVKQQEQDYIATVEQDEQRYEDKHATKDMPKKKEEPTIEAEEPVAKQQVLNAEVTKFLKQDEEGNWYDPNNGHLIIDKYNNIVDEDFKKKIHSKLKEDFAAANESANETANSSAQTETKTDKVAEQNAEPKAPLGKRFIKAIGKGVRQGTTVAFDTGIITSLIAADICTGSAKLLSNVEGKLTNQNGKEVYNRNVRNYDDVKAKVHKKGIELNNRKNAIKQNIKQKVEDAKSKNVQVANA